MIRARAKDSTDRWLVKYSVDKPAIRLLFRDTFKLMIMDKERNADTLADLLKDYRDEMRVNNEMNDPEG